MAEHACVSNEEAQRRLAQSGGKMPRDLRVKATTCVNCHGTLKAVEQALKRVKASDGHSGNGRRKEKQGRPMARR